MVAQAPSPTDMKAYQAEVVAEFRANDGTMSGHFAGAPLLLLTTTGARTGRPHTTPLTHTRDGARLVIIAAKAGAPTHPDWYHNLLANPNVTVEVPGEIFRAVARVAEGEERQRLFDQMAAQRPNFREFQRKTSRQLPVVVLERVLDKETDYPAFNRSFIAEFRASGGAVGGMFAGLPILLLTTTGAKSGQPRTAPLLYKEDHDRLLIVASKGGSPTHPDWYHNILANPEVTVEVGSEAFPARARITEGAERQRLFATLTATLPKLQETQASTARQLPVVVLERVGTNIGG